MVNDRISDLADDIKKLEFIKYIYETTSDFLSGGFYSSFMKEVNEQIEALQTAISKAN